MAATTPRPRRRDGDHKGYAGERQGHRKPLDDGGRDAAVEEDRLAEIAMHDPSVPFDHLQRQRLVQTELRPQPLDLFGRRARVEQNGGRIARNEPDDPERQSRNEAQNQKSTREAPGEKLHHLRSAASCGDCG